jgi:micrococcal nuclease
MKPIAAIVVLLLVVASLLASGCVTSTTNNTNQTPSTTKLPPNLPILSTGLEFPCINATPNRTSVGIVTKVVDGDTIHVSINGTDYKVRYIGMNAPENTSKKEPLGNEATERDKQLVAGKQVVLVKDVSETDKFGRLLRYVFVDNVFINYELVREGYATATRYPPDIHCQQVLNDAQLLAQQEHRGLWIVGSAS